MRRFKLTAAFLAISAVTFAIAAVVILMVSESQEKSNIARVTTEQSVRDARLLAGSISRTLADGMAPTAERSSYVGGVGASMSEFLIESNIIRLALYEIDGQIAWSSDGIEQAMSSDQGEQFGQAVAGAVVSEMRQIEATIDHIMPIDVIETYVPFLGADSDAPVQVLGVTRDVTGVLSSRIGATRWAMFRVTFVSLGGGFLLLLGFIVVADRGIWRSKTREINRERELGEERIASTRLDIENQELQKLNEDRSKLISLVSHELRTPLTSVLAFTDIVKKRQSGPSAEKNIKLLSLVKKSGDRLLEMIEEMLDMSRLESTALSLEKSDFELNLLVTEAAQKIGPILHEKRQHLQVIGDLYDSSIHADRNRLDQVLINLLSNASKYSPANTTIELSVSTGTNEVRIEVRDRGIGISEEDQQQIFGRFFRVDRKEIRETSGTGLGLSIAKAIIDQHNGELSVASREGRGTTFSVHIPTKVGRAVTPGILRPSTPWPQIAEGPMARSFAGQFAATATPAASVESLGEIAS